MTAALGSIAANGLAACMLAFGVHKRRSNELTASIPLAVVEVVPDQQLALPAPMPMPAPAPVTRPVARKPKPIQERPQTTPSSNVNAVTAPTLEPNVAKTGDVMEFAVAQLYPDARGTVLLTIAHSAYRNWCSATGCQPVDPGMFADDFAKIVRTLKLTAQMSPQGLVIRGVTIPDVKSNAA